MNKVLNLTIAIPVKNEEKNLLGCIKAIGKDLAKQIVIIDSGSTDKTIEIAKSQDVDVVNFNWDGKFPKKRNWFLRNYNLTTKWVLFLDADEYLTPEFKTELRAKLKQTQAVGFWLNYTIYFMGKKLKGGYPLNKLALFQVGAGEYERIDEDKWSNLDMEIHEHPILKGEIGYIKSKIDHRDFRGVSHYMNKHNEYASWEAYRYIKTINDEAAKAKWTWKQKIKYKLMQSALIGPVYFIGSFVFYGGWKDGATGFAFAILKKAYFTQIYCKIKELSNNEK
ncbi:glycosyltransferase family 2 protein [Neotamlana laminarinivorans]|uniref:Glycosyltransferase family 2 protein n=1 Tax=Neotamlana laminarinivorans TaxID=2883124 RepID=A0A9X1HZH3_9FLAO|nr:glycosyltransferase family 2 protein [Tamlana laminarinivorans]MCB4799009.1 glycosyltransferase family 2 protein [Tamlana laminarinivorans]